MIVLDTNVVSELMRPLPAPVVLTWLRHQEPGDLFTTAITAAEVRYGIARLPDGRRRAGLMRAADEALAAFPDQILPFDATAATAYADVVARCERIGSPIDGFDAQIAAICQACGARLATRNTKDFRDTGIELTDPWRAQQTD
jgi:hypothetical protein